MDIYEYLYEKAGKGLFSRQTFMQRVGADPFVITEEEFDPDSESLLEDMSLRCLNCFPNRRANRVYLDTVEKYQSEGNRMIRRIFFYRLYELPEAYAIRWRMQETTGVITDKTGAAEEKRNRWQRFRYAKLGRLRNVIYYWTVWQIWGRTPVTFQNKVRRMLGRETV